MSHLGIKPVIGGRPPIDRIVVESSNIRAGEDGQAVPISFMVVDVVMLMVRKIGVVVMT